MISTALVVLLSYLPLSKLDVLIVLLILLNIQFYNYAHRDDAAIRANQRRYDEWAKQDERRKAVEKQSERQQLIRIADSFAGVGKPQREIADNTSSIGSTSERPE